MALSAVKNVWRSFSSFASDITSFTDIGHSFPNSSSEVRSALGGGDVMESGHVVQSGAIELDFLEKKIKRLVLKLEKHGAQLEVFEDADIVYGRELGRGGEGIVHRCTVQYRGLPVEAAAKRVIKNTVDTISITLDEIELLCLARHPIIDTTLRVFGVAATSDPVDPHLGQLVIITEAGVMNCLQLYQRATVPLHVTYDLWRRLATAVHTMHSRKIVHRDLKPENVLITAVMRDELGVINEVDIRIIDLGMGLRMCSDVITADDIVGTAGYHAPEVLGEQPYDHRVDIFMLAVTFCVLLMPSSLLKQGLKPILQSLHEAKQNWHHPRRLFDTLIAPQIGEHKISARVRNMICDMLQNQSRRDISLLDVVDICQKEAAHERQLLRRQPQRALRAEYTCQDSGFCSDRVNSKSNEDAELVAADDDGGKDLPALRVSRQAARTALHLQRGVRPHRGSRKPLPTTPITISTSSSYPSNTPTSTYSEYRPPARRMRLRSVRGSAADDESSDATPHKMLTRSMAQTTEVSTTSSASSSTCSDRHGVKRQHSVGKENVDTRKRPCRLAAYY